MRFLFSLPDMHAAVKLYTSDIFYVNEHQFCQLIVFVILVVSTVLSDVLHIKLIILHSKLSSQKIIISTFSTAIF